MYGHRETSALAPGDRAEPDIGANCIRCGACTDHCRFLSRRGTPGDLAAACDADPAAALALAFECSLCGLCTAVCPQRLDPRAMFLGWRQAAVQSGRADLSPYAGILRYERKGCSKQFSFYSLPRGCDTVFFPGCTLAGTRPGVTFTSFSYLKTRVPSAGIVLDCCTKPSHDLGRKDFFEAAFGEMAGFLADHGVTTVVTACPSCHEVFKASSSFKAVSLYETMARDPQFPAWPLPAAPARVAVQDPCRARHDTRVQAAVRDLILSMGLRPETGGGRRTLCCGEGGAAGCIIPQNAGAWAQKRNAAAGEKNTVTYCAGCVNRLSGSGNHVHILDLIFDRDRALRGRARVSTAPFTYINRLALKRKLSALPAAITRERPRSLNRKRSLRPEARLPVIAAVLGIAAVYWAFIV